MAEYKMHHFTIRDSDNTWEIVDEAGRNNVANQFSVDTSYKIGDYCRKNGKLYRFVVNHNPSIWNNSDVEEVVLANELNNIKKDVTQAIVGGIGTEVSQIASDWLEENLQPITETVTIDKSLTVENAAAESASVGAQINSLSTKDTELNNAINANVNDIENLRTNINALDATIAGKVDNGYVEDGVAYFRSGDETLFSITGIGGGGGGGGGGGSNNAVLTVTNTTGWLATTVSQQQCSLSVNWSSLEDDLSTGDGNLTIKINNVQKLLKSVPQGDVTVNIGSYLSIGTNNVKLSITDIYGNTRTINFTVNYLSYTLASTFNGTQIFSSGIMYYYVATGSGNKLMHFVVDGVEIGTEIISTSGRQSNYYIGLLENGSHTLEVYFTITINEQPIESNRLYYDLICADSSASGTIIACPYNNFDVTQFETCVLPFIVWNSESDTVSVTLAVNGTVVSTLVGVDKSQHYWSYKATTSGTKTLTITSGEVTKTITLYVEDAGIDVEAETQNLALYLSSAGRSNNDLNRSTWEYNSIGATLSDFLYDTDGWVLDNDGNTCLRVRGNARVTIPYKLFGTDFKASGKTIELEFTTADTTDPEAKIISCMDGGRGISVTPQLATIASDVTSISTRFKENEHVRISFVVSKSVNNRLIFCYINGIASGCIQYSDIDNFAQASPVDITIGSNSATVDVYTIRVYDNDLTRYQILKNWIADTQDVDEMFDRYNRNDIYDEYGNIVISKLPGNLPYMIINGTSLPTYKGDKKTVTVEFTDPTGLHPNFAAENVQIDVQGTSSAGYTRKNFKCKFRNGFTLADGSTVSGYSMNATSIPTKTFTFKADVASSEGANNVELVRLYNDYATYKTEPQKENSLIRQGIDGFPMVIFFNNGTTTKFVGKYNFNNDKGTEEVYGFKTGDESWEILNNTDYLALFKDDDFSSWESTFEGRYPDGNTVTTNLQTFLSWVAPLDVAKDDPAYFAIYKTGNIDASGNEVDDTTSFRSLYVDSKETLCLKKEQEYIALYDDNNISSLKVVEYEYDTENEIYIYIRTTILSNGDSITIGSTTQAIRICVTTESIEYARSVILHMPYASVSYTDGDGKTYTLDTPAYRLAKFKTELSTYADIDALCFYYVFTELFLMIDSRAKNAFPSFFGNKKWLVLPYDFDTAIGINNQGKLEFGPYLEDTDYQDDTEVFNGQKSALWIDLRECFYDNIADTYNTLRNSGFSYAVVEAAFELHQGKWPEAIFNEDAWYKYILPLTNPEDGASPTDEYLGMLLGSKTEQRKWWLFNRFNYIDNKYQIDAITTTPNRVYFRAYAIANMTLTPVHDTYLVVKYGSKQVQHKALKDVPTVMECTLSSMNNTECYIYGCENIKSLGNLSPLNVGDVSLGAATNLQYLKIGDAVRQNTKLITLDLSACKRLKMVDLRNCVNLSGVIDVSNCYGLEELYLTGTKVTAVNLPRGGSLKKLHLPAVSSLIIINNPNIEEFVYDGDYSNITTLRIENAGVVNDYITDIVIGMNENQRIRLIDMDVSIDNIPDAYEFWRKIRMSYGIDSDGSNIREPVLTGNLYLERFLTWFKASINGVYPDLTITIKNAMQTTDNPKLKKEWNELFSISKTEITKVTVAHYHEADGTEDEVVDVSDTGSDGIYGYRYGTEIIIAHNPYGYVMFTGGGSADQASFNGMTSLTTLDVTYLVPYLYDNLGAGSSSSLTTWRFVENCTNLTQLNGLESYWSAYRARGVNTTAVGGAVTTNSFRNCGLTNLNTRFLYGLEYDRPGCTHLTAPGAFWNSSQLGYMPNVISIDMSPSGKWLLDRRATGYLFYNNPNMQTLVSWYVDGTFKQNDFYGCTSLTHCIFSTDNGIDFTTNACKIETPPWDYASLASIIECAVDKSEEESAVTLTLNASTFALLDADLIAKATAKNYTLASA